MSEGDVENPLEEEPASEGSTSGALEISRKSREELRPLIEKFKSLKEERKALKKNMDGLMWSEAVNPINSAKTIDEMLDKASKNLEVNEKATDDIREKIEEIREKFQQELEQYSAGKKRKEGGVK